MSCSLRRSSIFDKRSSAFVRMESDYNDNSTSQSSAADELCQWLAKYTKDVAKDQEVLNVAEYGCATGGSSISPLKTIFKHATDSYDYTVTLVSEMAADACACSAASFLTFLTSHNPNSKNDLPFNDWNVLSSTVEPMFPLVKFQYSKESMYKGLVAPEGSLHVGYSCLAQHWLSVGPPSPLPGNCLWANQLPRHHPTRSIWAKASEDDWLTFLGLRAREFAKGGYLVLAIQASRVDGFLEEAAARTSTQAKEELLREGVLSEKEVAAMVMPEYLKSPAEILEPLDGSDDWCVKEMHYWSLVDHPDRIDWEAGAKTDEEYVDGMVKEHQSFMSPSLHLDSEKLELYWNRVRDLALQDPARMHSNTFLVYLTLKRI